ncbi:DUF6082 family protein [Streptosporangium sp. NPDC051023]|uniref:DUF6082 family protein n=1 Tax=Streptosporangium sp. NPDC051023 TaxID=3155410 RepID=UPI00344B8109
MRGRPLLSRLAGGGRRFLVLALLFLLVLAVPGFVVISPLFLTLLNDQNADWSRLSDIGQTYGAASAVLAVFALMGVTASLILQARETKAGREQTLRALHTDLMRMAMDDPIYRACWGTFFTSENPDEQRAHMYVNMIVNHWLMMWELRAITEAHLRAISVVVLGGPVGWRFWTDARERRLLSASTRRERRFNRILDEVYRTVPSPPLDSPPPSPARSLPKLPLKLPLPKLRAPLVTRRTARLSTRRTERGLLVLALLVAVASAIRGLRGGGHRDRETPS